MQRLLVAPKHCNAEKTVKIVFAPPLRKIFTRTGVLGEYPPPAKIQFKPPTEENGFLHYERSWSGDMRYAKPQVPRTTFTEFLFFII